MRHNGPHHAPPPGRRLSPAVADFRECQRQRPRVSHRLYRLRRLELQCAVLLLCGLAVGACSPPSASVPIAQAQEQSEGLPVEQTQIVETTPTADDSTIASPLDCLAPERRQLRI